MAGAPGGSRAEDREAEAGVSGRGRALLRSDGKALSVLFSLALAAALRVEVPGGTIELSIQGEQGALSERALRSWVQTSARAVAAYYGGFPVPDLDLTIRTGGSGKISGGRTSGNRNGAVIRITVGEDTAPEDLASSWVLVHEMVHTAFPSMTGHEWLEEGLATYVEPLVRSRAGLIPADDIWKWLLWGLPRGLDGMDGRGLDEAGSWGARYWGGAAFCFLADVQIRERTGNRKSLDDALRGIVRDGGDIRSSWPIERALNAGDRATGVPVFRELYAKMGKESPKVDLTDLWKRLGVSSAAGRVVSDDHAPLAAIRKGIATGR